MSDYVGKVAVITGAASGIGYGLAKKCIGNEMRVVLADINQEALAGKRNGFAAVSKGCLAVPTDVTKEDEVQHLARESINAFGRIDFLFLNAGVNILANIWEYDILDWKWIIDVNLWGTIHCLKIFLPILRRQENESHLVITSSGGAFLPFQTSGPYNATKSAILGLAETLYNELRIDGSKISVHAICPGMVHTNLDNAEAQRPLEYRNPDTDYESGKREKYRIPRKALEAGISAEKVAEEVFHSMEKDEFYIFPQPEIKKMISRKYENLLHRNMPLDLSPARKRDS